MHNKIIAGIRKNIEIEKIINHPDIELSDNAYIFIDYKKTSKTTKEGPFLSYEGIIKSINQSFLNIFGYENKNEIIGKSIFQIFSTPHLAIGLIRAIVESDHQNVDSDFDNADLVIDQILKEDSLPIIQFRKKNGTIIHLEVKPHIIKIYSQHFIVLRLHDISEYNQATQKLQKLDDQLKITFQNSQDAKFLIEIEGRFSDVKTLKGTFTDVNESALQLLGLKKEELIDKDIKELGIFTLRQLSEIGIILSSKFHGIKNTPSEFIITRKDGKKIIVDLRIDKMENLLSITARDITKRRQSEMQFQLSQQMLAEEGNKLRTMIDNTPDLVYEKNLNHKFTVANKALADLIGTTPENLIGKKDSDFFPNQLARKYHSDEEEVFKTGNAFINGIEPVINQETGETKIYSSTKVPLRDSQGNITGLVGIGRDITERKKAEDILALEKDQLRTLIDNTPDHIWVKDFSKNLKGEFIIANKSLADHMNTTIESLINETNFKFYPEEQAQKFLKIDQSILQSGIASTNSRGTATNLKTGEERLFSTTIAPLKDIWGNYNLLIGIGHDITEIEKAEKSLRLSEKRFREVAENIQDIIYAFDPKGNLTLISGSYKNLFGDIDEQELIGANLADLIQKFSKNPQTLENILKQYQNAVQNKQNQITYEIQLSAIDKVRTFELNERIYYDSNGSVTNSFGVMRDITKRKTMEEIIKKLSIQKDEFLGSLSHELNTPLHALLGILQILVNDPSIPADELQNFFQTMLKCGYDLQYVMENILSLARSKYDLDIPNESNINLIKTIAEVKSFLKEEIKNSNTQFIDTIDNKTADIITSPAPLYFALLNIISNAVKFNNPGGCVIIESKVIEINGENKIQIIINDTGIGIPKDKLEIIQKEFTQVDTSPSRQYSGLGLGIPAATKNIKILGGTFEILSNENGTTCIITFPFKPVISAPEITAPESIAPTELEKIFWQNLLILIAEDTPTNILLFLKQLKGVGCKEENIIIAENGKLAIDKVKEFAGSGKFFDLFLMDIIMPKIDGIEAIQTIRKLFPHLKNAPSIALSALLPSNLNDRESIKQLFNHAISKPYDFSDLKKMILNLFPLNKKQEIASRNSE
ncbi:PAS domain S-box protein [Candidatus Margulisiibacteriota bacterium]